MKSFLVQQLHSDKIFLFFLYAGPSTQKLSNGKMDNRKRGVIMQHISLNRVRNFVLDIVDLAAQPTKGTVKKKVD